MQNNNLLIFKTAQYVSGNSLPNSLPIIRSARLWFTVCGILSSDCRRSEARSAADVESSNILHTEHTVRVAALRTSERQQSEDSIPHTVNHSLALLMMGKELPEAYWAVLKINKLLLFQTTKQAETLMKWPVFCRNKQDLYRHDSNTTA